MRDADTPLVLTEARVITLDPQSRIAQALVVRGNRIQAIGSTAECLEAAGPQARVIPLGGRAVIPGLIDTHAHMDREGLKQLGPSLAECRSIDDVLQRVEAAVRSAPPGAWVVTTPVGQPPYFWDGAATLREGRLPTRRELDRVAPDNPVYIRPIWGYWRHAPGPETLVSAANSLALAASGLDAGSVPPTASITLGRDADGELDGLISERGAMPIAELVMLSHASRFTADQRRAGVRRSMAAYNALGTTGVYEGHGVSAELFRSYRDCHRAGEMTVRVRMTHSPSWDRLAGADPAEMLEHWAYWAAGIGDPMLSLNGLYVDHRRAADDLIRARAAPYTGWAGFNYDSSLALEPLRQVLLAAARNDMQCVAIASDLIELLEEVDRQVPLAGRRWIVQHVGPLSDKRCEAAARLGLVITPLTIRYVYKEGFRGQPEQAADHLPLARLTAMGVPVTLASDNAPPSLFHSIWHAVARQDRFGRAVPPAEQKLTREQALRAATLNGAWLSFEEAERGSLEVGKLADLAVLTEDPLLCAEDRLPGITALLTVVDGRIVHDALGAARNPAASGA